MKKSILAALLFLLLFSSCLKEEEVMKVQYQVTGSTSAVEISYLDEQGTLQTTNRDFISLNDYWSRTYDAEQGQLIYLSARYTDSTSSVRCRIFIDGKLYKQNASTFDPGRYVIVSGTIPY
jgi:hypothetical protein